MILTLPDSTVAIGRFADAEPILFPVDPHQVHPLGDACERKSAADAALVLLTRTQIDVATVVRQVVLVVGTHFRNVVWSVAHEVALVFHIEEVHVAVGHVADLAGEVEPVVVASHAHGQGGLAQAPELVLEGALVVQAVAGWPVSEEGAFAEL